MSFRAQIMSFRAQTCHSEHNSCRSGRRHVIPSAVLSFRASHVIPSVERNPETLRYGCHIRFFTPLRSVQNDTAALRSARNDMTGCR